MRCPECGAANADDAQLCTCGYDFAESSATAYRGVSAMHTDVGGLATSGTSRSTPAPRPRSAAVFESGADINDRYRIQRLLGEGGMGEVYLAYDRELDRDVALKVIRTNLVEHPTLLDRFKREIALSSRVTHKNVLRVFDLGDAGGVKFLTMQYIEGQDLASVIRSSGRLPLPQVIDIFTQLCHGLAAAHEQGVIHRDLKPQNILLEKNSKVAIADFGLARTLEQTNLTEAGKIIGTPDYMSPEQVKGAPVDHRSDIFSLGIILYEMLTGTVPFTGDSVYAIMMQRVHNSPRPASDHNPQIPPYLLRILQRCMDPNADLRYARVEDIIADLQTQTFHTTLNYRIRRSRWVRLVAAIASVALLSGIGAAGWRMRGVWLHSANEAAPKSVGVFISDLENRTGEPVFDGTLESVLSLALEGASFINTYDRAQGRRVATQIQPNATRIDAQLARLVAVREGVSAVVAGSIARESDGYRLSLQTIEASTGRVMGTTDVTAADKESMLAAVGKAAAKLRTSLGDTTPEAAQLAAAETFTAGSLPAAHEYGAAQDLYFRGQFEEAAKHYEEAIRLDPNLGRAYSGLAAVYANLGRRNDAETYYKLAMSRLDRMTDREKYRTRGAYYLVMRNTPRAIDELSTLVKQYPSDMAGLNNLALAYFYQRDMGSALEASQRPINLYPKNILARSNAALYAMYAGDFPAAVQHAAVVHQLNPTYLQAFVAKGLSHLAQDQVAAAEGTYKQLATQSPRGASLAADALADLSLYRAHAAEAIATLAAAIEADRAQKRTNAAARKLATLAEAELLAGNKSAAVSNAQEAAKASPTDTHVVYTAAHVLVEAGQSDRAAELANQLQARIEPELQHHGKLIEGEILLHDGKAREALARFEEATKLADSWLARFDRGRAYLALKAFTEADSDFDACAKRRGEATAVFLDDSPTFHYFPPVYYYLGRSQEGLGSSRATEAYRQFLSIQGGDDGNPLVADARRRLEKP